jgi:hypothetical protein
LKSVERNDPLIDGLLRDVRGGFEAALDRYIEELKARGGPGAITYETLKNGRVRGILRPLDGGKPRQVLANSSREAAVAIAAVVAEIVKARQAGISVATWRSIARSIDQDAQDNWGQAYARLDTADRADAGVIEFRRHAPQA